MRKTQGGKRARKHKKEAEYAGLKTNTAHPSHVHSKDAQGIKSYWEKVYGGEKVKLRTEFDEEVDQ